MSDDKNRKQILIGKPSRENLIEGQSNNSTMKLTEKAKEVAERKGKQGK